MTTGQSLLAVDDLTVDYHGQRRSSRVRAVANVSFTIRKGATLGLVGESGSGKSSIGRSVLGLTRPAGGAIRYAGQDITYAGRAERRRLSRDIQVVFQDPYSSLNPSRVIGQALAEPLLASHDPVARSRQGVRSRVDAMLTRVGLDASAAHRYPSEFSGGQRQRIAIARALIVSPRLVVCDEAVSALDLSVQAQVLNLLLSLQEENEVSYLFISHNLTVVRHMAQDICVLYRGQVAELGPADRVYRTPAHPYTRRLLSAVPSVDRAATVVATSAAPLAGADSAATPGCWYQSRCPMVIDQCRVEKPRLEQAASGSLSACHRRDEVAAMAISPNPGSANAQADG